MYRISKKEDLYITAGMQEVYDKLLYCALEKGSLTIFSAPKGEGKTTSMRWAKSLMHTGLEIQGRFIEFDLIDIFSTKQEYINAAR